MSVTTRLFMIQAGSVEPIYRQLIEQTRRLIASGQLSPGDPLPSVRDMAAALAINPMTISKAYSLLEAEGSVTRRRGIGMTIAPPPSGARTFAARLEILRPTLEQAAHESSQLELPAETVVTAFKRILKGRQ